MRRKTLLLCRGGLPPEEHAATVGATAPALLGSESTAPPGATSSERPFLLTQPLSPIPRSGVHPRPSHLRPRRRRRRGGLPGRCAAHLRNRLRGCAAGACAQHNTTDPRSSLPPSRAASFAFSPPPPGVSVFWSAHGYPFRIRAVSAPQGADSEDLPQREDLCALVFSVLRCFDKQKQARSEKEREITGPQRLSLQLT